MYVKKDKDFSEYVPKNTAVLAEVAASLSDMSKKIEKLTDLLNDKLNKNE